MRKNLFLISFFLVIAGIFSSTAFAAVQIPSFPSCTNPQGKIIAQYPNGMHAIAGQDGLKNGSDTVYASESNPNNVTQCFCPPTELNGIQTNWLQSNTLSEIEKQELQNNGWLLQQNGATWGLANTPYLAQNSTYVCNNTGQQAKPPTIITAKVESVQVTAPVPTSTNALQSSITNTPAPIATSPQTPHTPLPNTGDNIVLLETLAGGIFFLCLSLFLKKKSA